MPEWIKYVVVFGVGFVVGFLVCLVFWYSWLFEYIL